MDATLPAPTPAGRGTVARASALRRADAAQLPVAAERRGQDLLGLGGLGADVGADGGGTGDDVVGEPAEALDLDLDDVSGLDGPGVGGGAGQEYVARVEGDGAGD